MFPVLYAHKLFMYTRLCYLKYLVLLAPFIIGASATTSAGTMLTSWYGPGFHGNLTANGEVYDKEAFTAAHKTLPFGTKLLFATKVVPPSVLTTVVRSLASVSLMSLTVLRQLDLSSRG